MKNRQFIAMPYDQKRVIAAFKSVMEEKELNPYSWATKVSKVPGEGNISHNTINSILNGNTYSPRLDTLYRLAEAAGVPLWELIGEEVPWKRVALSLRKDLREIQQADRDRVSLLDSKLLDIPLPDED